MAVLGTDCMIGKRTTCRFIMEGCREARLKAEMVLTGQTGWLQGNKYGFILDSTLNDFISGEIEKAIVDCYHDESPDLILVEGQSSLQNPYGPCGSEPDFLCLVLYSDNRKMAIRATNTPIDRKRSGMTA